MLAVKRNFRYFFSSQFYNKKKKLNADGLMNTADNAFNITIYHYNVKQFFNFVISTKRSMLIASNLQIFVHLLEI